MPNLVTIASILMHQVGPSALQKPKYAVHAKGKATGKLSDVEDSPSSTTAVGNIINAIIIRVKMDEKWVLEDVYNVQHDEVDLHTITIDPDPDKIHVDDATVMLQRSIHNTAYASLWPVCRIHMCQGGHWSWWQHNTNTCI